MVEEGQSVQSRMCSAQKGLGGGSDVDRHRSVGGDSTAG